MGQQRQVLGHAGDRSEMGHPVGQTSLEELKRLAGKVLSDRQDLGQKAGQKWDTEESGGCVPCPRPFRAGHGTPSTLATAAPDPLPPEGHPRRETFELIDQVWAAGGWLVITGDCVRAVHRNDTKSSLTPELLKAVKAHQAGLLRILQRRPR